MVVTDVTVVIVVTGVMNVTDEMTVTCNSCDGYTIHGHTHT